MTIETAVNISQLNSAYPRSTDLLKEGDDHIRMIKRALRSTFPQVTGAVTTSSSFLNMLPTAMTITTSGIRFNLDVAFNANKAIDAGGNVITNVGTTQFVSGTTNNDKDVVNVETLRTLISAIYPVGSLYFSTVDKNPSLLHTMFNGTTWVRFAQGNAVVGAGDGGTGVTLDSEQTTGEASHTLSTDETPLHSHHLDAFTATGTTTSNGDHQHSYRRFGSGGSDGANFSIDDRYYGNSNATTFGTGGQHNHTVQVDIPAKDTTIIGGGLAHNNIQPSIGVFIWKRTV